MKQVAVEKAIANPTRKFHTPDEVLQASHLKPLEKLTILKSWENEAHLLQIAENENMAGGEPTRLHEIRKAIDHLCKDESLVGQDGC